MAVSTPPGGGFAGRIGAPVTALIMLAQQIGANATRDALFLTNFPVTALPWFVALAAVASFPAALGASALLTRLGPRVVVPATFATSGVLFAAEATLLPAQPAASAVLLYFHATVLGAIVISLFWSLLDERFDSYTAKELFSRVAAAATLGAVLGGLGAERIAAVLSPGALLAVLAVGTAACVAGTILVGRGGERKPSADHHVGDSGNRAELVRTPYLRAIAAVTALAALVGTLCDYVFKADVSAQVLGGAPLIRFFGFFYAATGIVAFLIQAALARAVLGRLGTAASVAVHPVAVGAASLVALVAPSPWRGILPRSADVTVRHSIFRTSYELLYTSLPEVTRRSTKATIDVGWDCVGNGGGAAVVFLVTRLVPARGIAAVILAGIVAAAVELVVVWRLRTGYDVTVDEALRREGGKLPRVTHYTFDQLTRAIDDALIEHVPGAGATDVSAAREDPIAAARAALRSDNPARIRAALRRAQHEPSLVPAVIPLLGRNDLFDDAVQAVRAGLPAAADQLVDALTDPGTPEVVRRRLPLILRSCPSRRAFDGLVKALSDESFKVRQRCGRTLLAITDADPTRRVPREATCAAAERELDTGSGDATSMAHVFDLLALGYDRKTMALARGAYESGEAQMRGTALTYLETTLPRTLFVKLERRIVGRG